MGRVDPELGEISAPFVEPFTELAQTLRDPGTPEQTLTRSVQLTVSCYFSFARCLRESVQHHDLELYELPYIISNSRKSRLAETHGTRLTVCWVWLAGHTRTRLLQTTPRRPKKCLRRLQSTWLRRLSLEVLSHLLAGVQARLALPSWVPNWTVFHGDRKENFG